MSKISTLTLYILRHGECEHNVEGRLASQDDSPLTENGREQARANGRLLKSSPAISPGSISTQAPCTAPA